MPHTLFQTFLTFWLQVGSNFELKDIFDIAVMSFLLYLILLLIRRTNSYFVFTGISILFALYLIARFFDLYLTSLIFQTFFSFLIIILVIIFQRELRSFFELLANWRRILVQKGTAPVPALILNEIIKTVEKLVEFRTGALMVFSGVESMDSFLTGGTELKGKISASLLLSIFDSSSPGHDGAVIIKNSLIDKFGVHLPLAERFEFKNLGTRHRAALGLAERSDAFVIIVSEERGTISFAHQGKLNIVGDVQELKEALKKFLQETEMPIRERFSIKFLTSNFKEKLLALFFASLLWFIFAVELGGGVISRQFIVPVEFRFIPNGLAVDQVIPKTISITLDGKIQDFNFLNEDTLKVAVNLSNSEAGVKKIRITEDLLQHPSSLRIVSVSPSFLQFTLKK